MRLPDIPYPASGLGTSHTYTYDRCWNMIADTDQSGHTTNYTYDPTGNCLSVTVQYNIANGPYEELTQITDKNGNSVSIGTNQKDNSAADNPASASLCFLYNGQLGVQTDQNSLYYMRARYYNTDIKRFTNRDTVSGDPTNSHSPNRYSYVQGNPVSRH